MADTLKVLGQSAPAATTLTDIYTVPAATSAVVSCINVCNRAAAPDTFRVSVAPAGAADANAQYLVRDMSIAANDTIPLVLGITLATTDKVRVYGGTANLSFSVFGTEIT